MKVAVFSAKSYDRQFFDEANKEFGHELVYFEPKISAETAQLASGFSAVCGFVHDPIGESAIQKLAGLGIKLIALRCAGFNNVDLEAAGRYQVRVVRVPAYSPHAVAEHTLALILTLNRKLHRSYLRVREGNFSLDGLLGFDLYGKTAGIIGTGKIGRIVAMTLHAMGCNVLVYDLVRDPELEKRGISYTSLRDLYQQSDLISLHCPLNDKTHHLIGDEALSIMKENVMIINTSRGAVIDAKAAIKALKTRKIGYLGIDVYEEEEDVFYEDLSGRFIADDTLARLLTFNNVMITSHQGFFTREALSNIANITLKNITDIEKSGKSENEVVIA